ncbi:hypothetical protein Tco_0267431 [Tanacetum coccineum]
MRLSKMLFYLDEMKGKNNLWKDQTFGRHSIMNIEYVLLNHECVGKSSHDELEQVKKKSLEIQKGLKARIKILEKDVQRCEKQSVDFELKLQHEKEKHKWDSSKNKNSKPLDFSWISRIQENLRMRRVLDLKCKDDCKSKSGGLQFLRWKSYIGFDVRDSKSAIAIHAVRHILRDSTLTSNKRYDLMVANMKVDLDMCYVRQKQNSDEFHQESSLYNSALQLPHPFHGFIWHSSGIL